jgi:hypothetical protein
MTAFSAILLMTAAAAAAEPRFSAKWTDAYELDGP